MNFQQPLDAKISVPINVVLHGSVLKLQKEVSCLI